MKQPPAELPISGDEIMSRLSVLKALDGTGPISQRQVGLQVGIPLSRVNRLIRELVDDGQVEVDDTVRPFAYRLTPTGRDYHRRLAYRQDRSVVQRFRAMQARIGRRLQDLRDQEVDRLVLYGAGRVMEVTLPLARGLGLEVVGIVDDDPEKQGRMRGGLRVRRPEEVGELLPATILITTYRHAGEIREGLGDHVDESVRVVEL